MTNEIQQNRYDQTLRRITGIIGPGSKVAEVLTELFPVIDVERVPGELLILGGTDLGGGAASLDGGVGNSSEINIHNPADSGKLITVTRYMLATSAAQSILVGYSLGVFGGLTNREFYRDLRRGDLFHPVGQIRTLAAPTFVPADMQFRMLPNTLVDISDENGIAVLPPNSSFRVGTASLDQLLVANFFWRERAALPSELSI